MKKNIVLALLIALGLNVGAQNLGDTIVENSISIIGVGDIMHGTNFPSKIYLPPNDKPEALLEDVAQELRNADLTVGNLEGCFSDTAPLVKRCKDSTKCYAFRMPERYAGVLKDAGFDVLTIANNHSGDFGDLGRETTVKILDSLDIHHAGWEKYPTKIFVKDSLRYGVCAFAPNRGTVSIVHIAHAQRIVKEISDSVDITIVTFHGGAEGSKHQHVTRETEEFYGENRGNVYEFAHAMVDAGADVVFGHGPHVVRSIDLYKDRFIVYSLGNFCTYGRFNLRGPNGLAPIIKVNMLTDGTFVDGQIIAAKQVGRGITRLDAEKKVIKKYQELLQADFPEVPISISNDGLIQRNEQ